MSAKFSAFVPSTLKRFGEKIQTSNQANPVFFRLSNTFLTRPPNPKKSTQPQPSPPSPIIEPMRALFFALMIALLLLRGWVGDAMANEMALAPLQHPHQASQPQLFATKTIAAHAHGISANTRLDLQSTLPAVPGAAQAPHDCAGHAANDDTFPAAFAHCPSCDACQACHSVALIPACVNASPAFGPRIELPAQAAHFASADAAPGQKPPIS